MRKNFFAAALIASFALSGAACAQEQINETTAEGASSMEGAAAEDASSKIGAAVYDSGGRQVGTIDDVITGSDGARQAVVSVGTYLGLGTKRILVPVTALTENEGGSGYQVGMTADEIEAAPEYSPAEPMPE